VRHVGLSDVPAWYAARAQTLAECRGWEPVCALQLEYSLVERQIEFEEAAMLRDKLRAAGAADLRRVTGYFFCGNPEK